MAILGFGKKAADEIKYGAAKSGATNVGGRLRDWAFDASLNNPRAATAVRLASRAAGPLTAYQAMSFAKDQNDAQAAAKGYASGTEYGLAREEQQMQEARDRHTRNMRDVLRRVSVPEALKPGANRASGLNPDGSLPVTPAEQRNDLEGHNRRALRMNEPPAPAAAAPATATSSTAPENNRPHDPQKDGGLTPDALSDLLPSFRAGAIRTGRNDWKNISGEDFGAPAGTQAAQKQIGPDKVTALRDAAGNVTFTNTDKYQPLASGNVSTVGIDKAAIERGMAADRDLHNARIEAMDGRAPVEGGRVAVMGGEQPTGGADNTSPALRDLLNSPRAKYRMAAAQLLAGQDNNVADRASQDARAAAGLQAQAQRDEANNRAQALRDANNNAFTAGRDDLRFNRDVQLKGMEVGAAREKALRDWQDKQYDSGRAYRADQRTEEAHYAAQQKAVADALADMLGEDKRDDKGFVTGRLPNPQAAQALLGEYANAPADLKGFRDDKGNLVPIQHLDKNLQNKLVNAYLLRQQLAGARGKMGVDDVDALPSMWEMVTTPGAVSVAEDGSVKIGAGKINSAVSGGSTNLPWAGISESQLREIQKRVRALNGG